MNQRLLRNGEIGELAATRELDARRRNLPRCHDARTPASSRPCPGNRPVGGGCLVAPARPCHRTPRRHAPARHRHRPPAMRARREAAFALATMPDDPWTFAESLAASAPDKLVAKEDCGVGDGPQFSKPTAPEESPVQTAGASQRYLNAQARMDATLRASADPLDRAVADLVNVGDMRSETGADEAVVQQAAASTDPRLFALGFGLCSRESVAARSLQFADDDRWIDSIPGTASRCVGTVAWRWRRCRGNAGGDGGPGVGDPIRRPLRQRPRRDRQSRPQGGTRSRCRRRAGG